LKPYNRFFHVGLLRPNENGGLGQTYILLVGNVLEVIKSVQTISPGHFPRGWQQKFLKINRSWTYERSLYQL